MSRASRLSGSIAKVLGNVDQISPILAQAERLRRLQQELDQSAPAELARGCRIASLRQGTLTIRVNSNAHAAKIRVLVPRLVERFTSVSNDVKAVKVEVQFLAPPMDGSRRRNRNVITPPEAPLRALADELPESRLRDAIESLARKGRK